MGILKSLFGKVESPEKPYVNSGFRLAHKLANSLHLEGWVGTITYTERENKVIKEAWAELETEYSGISFHPGMKEGVAALYRTRTASALQQLAGDDWAFTQKAVLPEDWKERVSAYLKSWAADLSPFAMSEVAELRTLAGYKTEAKEAYQVVVLYPDYARSMPGMGYDKPLQIVERAREKILKL
jgi:hypothetical protein